MLPTCHSSLEDTFDEYTDIVDVLLLHPSFSVPALHVLIAPQSSCFASFLDHSVTFGQSQRRSPNAVLCLGSTMFD